jgi:hypothetical protein
MDGGGRGGGLKQILLAKMPTHRLARNRKMLELFSEMRDVCEGGGGGGSQGGQDLYRDRRGDLLRMGQLVSVAIALWGDVTSEEDEIWSQGMHVSKET